MRHSLLPALALLFALLCGGCSEEESFSLSLLTADERPDCGSPLTASSLATGRFTLRVTFLQRGEAPATISSKELRDYTLVCDRVIGTGKDVDLLVDRSAGSTMTVRVEAFEGTRLVYTGQREDVDINGAEVQILMRPAQKASCAAPAPRLHVFHSATLLPNGQVLMVGGLAERENGGDNLAGKLEVFAHGGVDLYDPNTGRFVRVTGPTLAPRVFHQAALLPGPVQGPYRVLLIGGITPSAPDKPAARIKVGVGTFVPLALPFNISPHETAGAAPAELLTITYGAADESPTLAITPLPSLPKGMFGVLAEDVAGGRAMFAPGAGSYAATADANGVMVAGFAPTTNPPAAQWIALPAGGQPSATQTVPMVRTRVGHGLVRLAGGIMLAFGGQMHGAAPAATESLARSDGVAPFIDATPGGQTEHTAWQVFAPLGLTDQARAAGQDAPAALWVGGFKLDTGDTDNYRIADAVPATAQINVIDAAVPPQLTPGGAPAGFASAGYQAAVRLWDGSVLVSGGNAARSIAERFTALDQVARFRYNGSSTAGELPVGVTKLSVPRFGHRATRLLDNTVLISGGLTFTDSKLRLVERAELLNLRAGTADEDYPLMRAPATEAQRCAAHKEPAAQSSPITIVSDPEPRTDMRRRIRSARGPRDVARVRIRLGGSPR